MFVLLAILSSIMNMTMAKMQKLGRIRQLHTIISQETIKPSSPTPPPLKTHNLSSIDYLAPNVHMPFIFFYKNYNFNSDVSILKKSLSQCLTQYYPFAGRLQTPFAPSIECNDLGIEFFEASVDSRLDDFILKKEQDETLDRLIPNALGCASNITSPSIAAVQLNHFACGGAAMAASISHKVADAFTMAKFINDWAFVTRGGSPIKIGFYSSPIGNIDFPEVKPVESYNVKYATRSFVFPNSKLKELKNKINAMDTLQLNPTRVESLTSLLYKCAVGATTTKSGSFIPSKLHQMVNLRGKTNANFPQLAAGNLFAVMITKTTDSDQIELNKVITSMRKQIMELQRVRDAEEVGKTHLDGWQSLFDDRSQAYMISSICRFPFYQVDFGWGNPIRVMVRLGSGQVNFLVLMDTPHGDGIEATVQLKDEVMAIFQKDKELLKYVED